MGIYVNTVTVVALREPNHGYLRKHSNSCNSQNILIHQSPLNEIGYNDHHRQNRKTPQINNADVINYLQTCNCH